MQYQINKGEHKHNTFSFALHFGKAQMKRILKFHSSCFYEFKDEDRYDINKAYGFSEGLHHKNSARFGWRCNPESNKIELLAYVYCDGKRINEWDVPLLVRAVSFDQEVETSIEIFKTYYEFSAKTQNGKSTIRVPRGKRCIPIGYQLYPYFGGNKTAPNTMYLEVSKV